MTGADVDDNGSCWGFDHCCAYSALRQEGFLS